MALPAIQVLADFSGGGLTGTPSTDISAFVDMIAGYEITVGRQDEDSTVSASQLNGLTLNNADGRFTAGRTGLTLNLLSLDVAAPGSQTGTVTSAAPTLGASVTVSIDTTQKLPVGPASSLKVNIPSTLAALSRAEESVMFACTGTTAMSFAAQINATGTSVGVNGIISWYTSGLALISRTLMTQVPTGTTGYSTIATTSPATAAFFTVGCGPNTMAGSATSCYIGNFCAVLGATIVEETVAPYYPHVDVGVRIKVIETVAGVPFTRADVYADSWLSSLNGGLEAITVVSGSDILARYGIDTPLNTLLAEEILVDAPACLYMLQEDEGSISFGDATGKQPAATIVNSKYGAGVVASGQTPTGNFVGGTVVDITNAAYLTSGTTHEPGSLIQFPLPAGMPVASTFEIWVQMPTVVPTFEAYIFSVALPNGNSASLSVDSTGLFQWGPDFGALDATVSWHRAALFDGNMHQFVLGMLADNLTPFMAVDGQLLVNGVNGANVFPAASAFPSTLYSTATVQLGMNYVPGTSNLAFTGGFAYAGCFPSVVSAARILQHYNAGANGCNGDTTVQRVNRLQTYRPGPSAPLVSTCSGTMGAQDTETLQQALLDCAAAEGTVLYFQAGQAVLVPRQYSYGNGQTAPSVSVAPICTLDSSQAQVDAGTTATTDGQYVANQIDVSRPNGSDQQVNVTASQAKYGIRNQSITLPVASDADALLGAQWVAAQGSTAKPRTISLLVDLLTEPSTTQQKAVLGVTPLSLLTATNLPSQFPASTMNLFAQGWTETVSIDDWTIEFNCSPALNPGVLQLDTGGPASQLDSGLVFGW